MSAERRRMSRARILDGAAAILDSGVYGDLTVDALARSLHMSKSTLYKYFASKEDVIVALVDICCTAVEEALDTNETVQSGRGPEALDATLDLVAKFADEIPRAIILQTRRLPNACQVRLEVARAVIARAFRNVVARGAEEGDFISSEAGLAATALIASANASMEAAARGEIPGSRGEAVRALGQLFFPGLTATASV